MASTIVKEYATPTHKVYTITYFNYQVHTVVTASPAVVTAWISHVRSKNKQFQPNIVGLDTESHHPVAVIQICMGLDCLIYQLLRSSTIPPSLHNFLNDPRFTFCGNGIKSDVKQLQTDYELVVRNYQDVGREAYNRGLVRVNPSLKEVSKVTLGWEIEKSKEVTMSEWDRKVLGDDQIKYACIDAFLSYKIGVELSITRTCELFENMVQFG